MVSGDGQQVYDDDVIKKRIEQFDEIFGRFARILSRLQAVKFGIEACNTELEYIIDLVNGIPRL